MLALFRGYPPLLETPKRGILTGEYRQGGTAMKVTGRCHCGQISFEAEIDPAQVRICHCADCQTLTGTAFRTTVPSLPGCRSRVVMEVTRLTCPGRCPCRAGRSR